MIDLYAIAGVAADGPLSSTPLKHTRQSRRGEMFMSIEADQPVDSQFFDDPELTLICRADLLAPDRAVHVAAQLVRLYREQGDKFVCALRGTFAIILYDHRVRSLKAWTDHFGAERLVFAEFGNSLTVSTDIGQIVNANPQRPSIEPAAIPEYLQYTCIPTPKTIYQGISKLAPGHQVSSRPTVTTASYWDMAYDDAGSVPERAWADKTRGLSPPRLS